MIREHELARRDLEAAAAPWSSGRPDRWAPVPAEIDRAVAADRRLAEVALEARVQLLRAASRRLSGLVPPGAVERYGEALLAVPRERFVIPEEIACSADDMPSPLDAEGLATVSAPHAYLLTYGLLGLDTGDHLLELGSGTGYGAALASRVVGPDGRITTIEIDAELHERAARLLAEPPLRGPAPITLLLGDARALAPSFVKLQGWPLRVAVTYAVPEPPEGLLALLPEGGRLVAPVGTDRWGDGDQLLIRWTREGGALLRTTHGAVRYVAER